MGPWNYYFICKLILFWLGYIDFHVLVNILFAFILIIPVKNRFLRFNRVLLGIFAAIALLYYDSKLPGIQRVISAAPQLKGFTAEYMLELVSRFINPKIVQGLFFAILALSVLGLKLRITSFVLLFMLGSHPINDLIQTYNPLNQPPENVACNDTDTANGGMEDVANLDTSDKNLNKLLADFYSEQSRISVGFDSVKVNPDAAFDILIFHICSLAWTDINPGDIGPMFADFDVLFKKFNSGASYSGPAAIRLLRGSCGLQPHESLYSSTASQCYVHDALVQAGYQTQLMLNHDGKYENYLPSLQMRERGGWVAPMLGELGARVAMKAFYGSPIYDDLDVLTRWMDQKRSSLNGPVALYYNTISLHDGNKLLNQTGGSTIETYNIRLKDLISNYKKFLEVIRKTKRPTLVLFIPEHGASLHGDALQIPGMREIPSPEITIVPTGMHLVNFPGKENWKQVVIDKPTSYTAAFTLIANLIHNPAGAMPLLDRMNIANLPTTQFVAQNEQTIIMGYGSRFFLRDPNGKWSEYKSNRR